MRTITVLATLALALLADARQQAGAQGAWCAFYDPWTYNCGFYTFEQCRATVSGAGGYCQPNAWAAPAPAYEERPVRPYRRPRNDRY
jgi:hypothetical protein